MDECVALCGVRIAGTRHRHHGEALICQKNEVLEDLHEINRKIDKVPNRIDVHEQDCKHHRELAELIPH